MGMKFSFMNFNKEQKLFAIVTFELFKSELIIFLNNTNNLKIIIFIAK